MNKPTIDFPNREDIKNVQPGKMAIDCFGKVAKVVSVSCCKEDIHGNLFVCYYTQFGDAGSSISMSRKENHITRTVGLTRHYKSSELDDIEEKMRKERGLTSSNARLKFVWEQ